jgi:hypothetical protein
MEQARSSADFAARFLRGAGHNATTARIFTPKGRAAAVTLLDGGAVNYWLDKKEPQRIGVVPWVDCLFCGEVHVRRKMDDKYTCGVARFVALVQSFPSLRRAPYCMPWRAVKFATWAKTSPSITSGSHHAAAFVLSVWHGSAWPHKALAFDVVRAMGSWDESHRNAFRAWALNPWWP